VDPTLLDNYALRKACINGHTNVVDILLQDKRVNLYANVVIQYARGIGNTKIIDMIQASLARLRFSQVKT
jgi:hypothetical protein